MKYCSTEFKKNKERSKSPKQSSDGSPRKTHASAEQVTDLTDLGLTTQQAHEYLAKLGLKPPEEKLQKGHGILSNTGGEIDKLKGEINEKKRHLRDQETKLEGLNPQVDSVIEKMEELESAIPAKEERTKELHHNAAKHLAKEHLALHAVSDHPSTSREDVQKVDTMTNLIIEHVEDPEAATQSVDGLNNTIFLLWQILLLFIPDWTNWRKTKLILL